MPVRGKTNDQVLIAMCQAGDNMGYTALYNKYAKRIYNSIYRIVSHTAEAEDILQESFLSAFDALDQLNSLENFEAWIKRIAINRSISHLRKKKIQFSDAECRDIADESEHDITENEIFDGKVEDVKNAIGQLPQGYRTILSLYLFENIPQEEIGKILGISYNTVRTQYHRAKKKVMQSLKDKTYHGR